MLHASLQSAWGATFDQTGDPHPPTLPAHRNPASPVLCGSPQQSLDSPDQRVAQDLPLLTASLSEVLTQLAAVPFNIFWYTHLTRQVG